MLEAGGRKPPPRRPRKAEAAKRSRKLEFGYWFWTCAVLGVLPLMPRLFSRLLAHQPFDPGQVSPRGELLWSALAIVFTAMVRAEIDKVGDEGLRLWVLLFSLLVTLAAFLTLLSGPNTLLISAVIFVASLVLSFYPTVMWQ
jgi:hypothetical protein